MNYLGMNIMPCKNHPGQPLRFNNYCEMIDDWKRWEYEVVICCGHCGLEVYIQGRGARPPFPLTLEKMAICAWNKHQNAL